MKQYIVDRIENGFMVLETEDKQTVNLPHSLLPEAKEGDVITLSINQDEKEKRHDKTRALMDTLFED